MALSATRRSHAERHQHGRVCGRDAQPHPEDQAHEEAEDEALYPKKPAKAASAPKENRWTDELKAKVRNGLKKGETYVAIARAFKVTPQTLWAVLNRDPTVKARRRS